MGATWFEEPLIKLQGMQEDWLHIVSAAGGGGKILGSSFFQLKEDKMLRTNLKLWSSLGKQ